MHGLIPRPSHPRVHRLQYYRTWGGHAVSTEMGRPLLDAYLLHNTEEGLGVEEGSQPIGGSFGHTPSQQPVEEGEPEHQVLHPLSQRPAERGRRRSHQLLPVTGRT